MSTQSTAVLFGVLAIGAGAAIFASRRPDPVTNQPGQPAAPPSATAPPIDPNTPLPAGHPPIGEMPAGHPPTGNLPAGHPPIGSSTAPTTPIKADAGVTWTVPTKWQQVPHMSTMRIATYRIPKVAGDIEDPEMSVTRAGGDVDANAQRWVDQFEPASRPNVKRSKKTIGALDVHIVDGAGGFTTMSGEVEKDWAMLGAIVVTEGGSHFFKLTGPKKSVEAARSDFDSLIASIKAK